IGLRVNDREEAISVLAALLLGKGNVAPEFLAAVLQREKEFPTGLPTQGMPIALPHTEARHVHKSSMAIGILERPVLFREMGSPDREIPVSAIFLLAIADHDSQVLALQQLADLFQDGSTLARLAVAHEESQVHAALLEGTRRLQQKGSA
ncbi:MAG TPA: PTS sugar transporter subunit IIA, partial [Anaerolineales bacterium]|nr:PTS sugar transporter subunit IIA [Anaerolineales bacterium]